MDDMTYQSPQIRLVRQKLTPDVHRLEFLLLHASSDVRIFRPDKQVIHIAMRMQLRERC